MMRRDQQSYRASRESDQRKLKALREKFSRFRKGHRPKTRIPEKLRLAALAALEDGINRGEVLEACKVSSDQVDTWEKKIGKGQFEQARVFSVSDGDVEEPSNDRGSIRSLELVVNGWTITLRPASR